MSAKKVKVGACPTLQLPQTNSALVCLKDFANSVNQVKVSTKKSGFDFSVKRSEEVSARKIWLNEEGKKLSLLASHQDANVCRSVTDTEQPTPNTIVLEVDLSQTEMSLEHIDSLAREFLELFRNQMISVCQRFIPGFKEMSQLVIVIKSMEGVMALKMYDLNDVAVRKIGSGICHPNAMIIFNQGEGSCLNLVDKYTGETTLKYHHPSITIREIQNMGIGGLDDELKTILIRAFASRLLAPDILTEFGSKHVKGVLLYGPTGTGKTLMAHQIGKLWNSRKPKVVNGHDLFAKHVRDAEADIRKLFVEAQEEEKRLGPNSDLHIIIFDNIDAICKEKGAVAGAAGVQTSLVKEFSSIIGGFNQLNNVLVIGTANRKESIFKGLLCPGRMEVHVEIGLPNESGRAKILEIHIAKLKENNMLASDVDVLELAAVTQNLTGAEIENLVHSAQSMARVRLMEASSKDEVKPGATENVRVIMSDFKDALEKDIKPHISRGIITAGDLFQSVFRDGHKQTRRSKNRFGIVSILLEGPPGAGKTAIAAQLIKGSGFPFVQICTPRNMIGLSESARCVHIRKMFDEAAQHGSSCILIDNIERIVDYVSTGPFSSKVLRYLNILLNERTPAMRDRKLLVLCTTSSRKLLEECEKLRCFRKIIHVPYLATIEHLVAVLKEIGPFSEIEIDQLVNKIECRQISIPIKELVCLIDAAKGIDENFRVMYLIDELEYGSFITSS